ncbi:MAG TPA: hypothetical protein VIY51_14420 [Xanthobacteraceae bacterium]
MTRRGRKRKFAPRHPGGDLVRREPQVICLAMLQPHRVWLPEEKRMDQKAASPLGCLNLLGVLSDAQYLGGLRYAVVVGKYRAVIETPRAVSGAGRGYDCPGDLKCGREPGNPCECRRRKERYDAAFAAVLEAGQRAARAVARVAVHGEACPRGALADLKRGLDALAKHFGGAGRRSG